MNFRKEKIWNLKPHRFGKSPTSSICTNGDHYEFSYNTVLKDHNKEEFYLNVKTHMSNYNKPRNSYIKTADLAWAKKILELQYFEDIHSACRRLGNQSLYKEQTGNAHRNDTENIPHELHPASPPAQPYRRMSWLLLSAHGLPGYSLHIEPLARSLTVSCTKKHHTKS